MSRHTFSFFFFPAVPIQLSRPCRHPSIRTLGERYSLGARWVQLLVQSCAGSLRLVSVRLCFSFLLLRLFESLLLVLSFLLGLCPLFFRLASLLLGGRFLFRRVARWRCLPQLLEVTLRLFRPLLCLIFFLLRLLEIGLLGHHFVLSFHPFLLGLCCL